MDPCRAKESAEGMIVAGKKNVVKPDLDDGEKCGTYGMREGPVLVPQTGVWEQGKLLRRGPIP